MSVWLVHDRTINSSLINESFIFHQLHNNALKEEIETLKEENTTMKQELSAKSKELKSKDNQVCHLPYKKMIDLHNYYMYMNM